MANAKKPMVIIDAGRAETPQEPVDEEVEEEFLDAGHLGCSRELAKKLKDYTDKDPVLSGGDVDAAWDQADVGDETVGGDNPTPDQDVVDELGRASGITYNDAEPLHTADKLEQRDKRRWELNPASSEDFDERSHHPDRGGLKAPSKKR